MQYSNRLLLLFFYCGVRYQLLLRDLVRYTEKGLDILARRSSDGDLSANAANTDHLRSSLQDDVETLSRALRDDMTIVPSHPSSKYRQIQSPHLSLKHCEQLSEEEGSIKVCLTFILRHNSIVKNNSFDAGRQIRFIHAQRRRRHFQPAKRREKQDMIGKRWRSLLSGLAAVRQR